MFIAFGILESGPSKVRQICFRFKGFCFISLDLLLLSLFFEELFTYALFIV